MVVLVNQHRKRGGDLPAGVGSGRRPRCAWRVDCSVRREPTPATWSAARFFAHTNTRGESPFDRIRKVGYPPGAQAENISAGRPSPEAVVAGWMDSPGHCANIMDPTYREIGVGYYPSADMMGHYWTQTFGRR